ncbi:MerR family transcriptional regulator [Pelagibacterales bacterium SAG-MED01]|nr:MerR family transcriptional regulator [Pelagibacterales bacterium SAG-MED01]
MIKSNNAYKSIGEVAEILQLKSKRGNSLQTHTIRYWEKEFKQIRPKILNGNRRYYDKKNIELLKRVKFLLKHQGMTIKGVKKILDNKEPLKLDELPNNSIKASNIRNKLTNISNLIKNLKNLK